MHTLTKSCATLPALPLGKSPNEGRRAANFHESRPRPAFPSGQWGSHLRRTWRLPAAPGCQNGGPEAFLRLFPGFISLLIYFRGGFVVRARAATNGPAGKTHGVIDHGGGCIVRARAATNGPAGKTHGVIDHGHGAGSCKQGRTRAKSLGSSRS